MYRLFTVLLFALLPTAIQAGGSLRAVLPADTVAYLRLIGAGEFNGAAPDSPLYRAFAAATLEPSIGKALLKDLAQDPPARQEAPWLEFAYRLRAPIEAVLLPTAGQPLKAANLLLRTGLDAASIDEVNALLDRIDGIDPAMTLVHPLDAEGYGVAAIKGQVPLLLKFDAADQSLLLMTGMAADMQVFKQTLAALAEPAEPTPGNDSHPMLALEQRIDSSGQGPFLWLDLPRLMQGIAAASPEAAMMAQSAGLQGVRAAAMGWGTRDGKGRFSLVIDAPKASSLNQMLPAIVNDFSLTARGRPGFAATLNIPGPALLRTVEGLLAANPQAAAEYQQNKQLLSEFLGLSVDRLIGTLGPELVLFSDTTGIFLGLRVSDQGGLDTLLETLAGRPDMDYEARLIDGQTYHHLAFSMPASAPADDSAGQATGAGSQPPTALEAYLDRMTARLKTHLYWVQDGDWLVFGQVPQSLFDRQANTDVVVIGDWLRDQQRQRTENALLLVSAELDRIPRTLYYAYLGGLEMIGDLAGTPADLLSRPAANTLQLPQTGSYGMQLDLSDPYLTLELSFEANPMEFLFATNATTGVAVLGVLAAIAIPAYQDYLLRAQVSAGMPDLARGKAAVTAYYMTHGKLPANRADTGLTPNPGEVISPVLSGMDIEDGRVTITFGPEAPEKLQGQTVSATPYASGAGRIAWRCGHATLPQASIQGLETASGQPTVFVESTVEPRYLPASCRP